MIAGAALCLGLGIWPGALLHLVDGPVRQVTGLDATAMPIEALGPLVSITRVGLVLVGLIGALALLRAGLLRGRDVRSQPTWGCGYEAPTARMQYTGSSFSQPLLVAFGSVVPRRVLAEPPAGYFPEVARYSEEPGDVAGERILVPASRRFLGALGRLRVIQQGRVQTYLVYVLVTLIALLLWQLSTP
jgi:hypothetical protein